MTALFQRRSLLWMPLRPPILQALGLMLLMMSLVMLSPSATLAHPLVVVISIDGLGTHLLSTLSPAEVPHLTKLARDGDQAIRAETIALAKTIPGHASMLSGVDTPKHQRSHNDFDPDLKKLEVPTIFDLAKLNGLRVAAVFGKDKLSFLFDTGALDKNIIPRAWPIGDWWGRIPSVVDDRAISVLKNDKPDLLFIHYAWVDSIGHIFKWESVPQRFAVRNVDDSLGRLIAFLDKNISTLNPSGDGYAMIVTADHGGNDVSHGQGHDGILNSPETDLVIPWIVYRTSATGIDNSTRAQLIDPKAPVKVYDTAATAAGLLGLQVPPTWNWDGVNRLK